MSRQMRGGKLRRRSGAEPRLIRASKNRKSAGQILMERATLFGCTVHLPF